MVNPGAFGSYDKATWAEYEGGDEVRARIVAAIVQHLAAVKVDQYAKDHGLDTDDLVARMGNRETAGTLRRKLRGEASATMVDLGVWAAAIGEESWLATREEVAEVMPALRRRGGCRWTDMTRVLVGGSV